MKTGRYDLLHDVAAKVFDENAWTTRHLADEIGCSQCTANDIAKQKVKLGIWQQVWKHDTNGHPVPAYRRK